MCFSPSHGQIRLSWAFLGAIITSSVRLSEFSIAGLVISILPPVSPPSGQKLVPGFFAGRFGYPGSHGLS